MEVVHEVTCWFAVSTGLGTKRGLQKCGLVRHQVARIEDRGAQHVSTLEAYFVSAYATAHLIHLHPILPYPTGIFSSDRLTVAQNYIRSCNGSTTHPSIRDCLNAAAARLMQTVLSQSANNGLRGTKNTRDFETTHTAQRGMEQKKRQQLIKQLGQYRPGL